MLAYKNYNSPLDCIVFFMKNILDCYVYKLILFAAIVSLFWFQGYCASNEKKLEFGNPNTDLVRVTEKEYNVVFDIRYATKNNFTKSVIYNNSDVYVHKDVAPKLKLAAKRASELGYKIKIFDAWRPYEAQKKLFDVVSDPNYVSPPDGPCGHCRGAAIDLTLVDASTGKELNMGTGFDSFEEAAHHTTNITDKEVLRNRVILAGIMNSVGLSSLRTEWWHYQIDDMMSLYPKYRLVDFKSNK